MSTPDLKEVVREKYGQAALRVKSGEGNPYCRVEPSAACCDPITSNLYDARQEGEVPDTVVKASLGCGNPISAFVRANKPAFGGCAPNSCK